MFSQITNVVRKEFTDAVRDQRSLIASMAFAIMGPLLIYVILTTIADSVSEETDFEAAIVGAEQAPTLVNWLKEREIVFREFQTEQDALNALDSKLLTAVVINTDYAAKYNARQPAEIRIYGNFKRDAAQTEAYRIQRLINAYGSQVMSARLIAEGIPPSQLQAISARRYDLSRAGGQSVQFSGVLTYMFLMAGFISGAFIAADTVAGERERKSLQPLLAQPVTPSALVIGKWLVTAFFAMLVSTTTIILGGYLLSIAPLAELGLRFFTSPQTIILGAISALPLAAFAAALQLMLASRAKSYREAATYAQYTMFLPILIVGATQFANVEYGEYANYLPISGNDYAMRELFLEGSAPIIPILATTISSFAIIAVLLYLTTRTLADEKSLG